MKAIGIRRAVERMRPYHPPLEGRADKLRMDFNENPLGCSPAVRRALRKLAAASISTYPEQETVRSKIARHFGVRPEEFLLTNGTDEALSLVVNTFVDSHDRVLLVEPTYAMYRFYSELAGARVVAPRYDREMRFPWKEVISELDKGPVVFFLPNPSSPTGNLLSPADVRRVLEAAQRTLVVIDEAYFEFSGVTVIGWIRRHQNLIVTRTFSKAAGLAGLRLGCLFVHAEMARNMRKAQSPYPVNVAALAAAEAVMRDRRFVAWTVREARRGRRELERGLARLGVKSFPSAGNFVLVYFGKRAKEIVGALEHKGILLRDRSSDFGGEGYVRITFGTLHQTRRLLRELESIL
ncbi:MAG TPA: histidinol-phosphate transaminase [Candidatus Acidoferrales bacterium]|nr:histidinol-phosphate transaminase [Candidatus Acidoferrales bacterium]